MTHCPACQSVLKSSQPDPRGLDHTRVHCPCCLTYRVWERDDHHHAYAEMRDDALAVELFQADLAEQRRLYGTVPTGHPVAARLKALVQRHSAAVYAQEHAPSNKNAQVRDAAERALNDHAHRWQR